MRVFCVVPPVRVRLCVGAFRVRSRPSPEDVQAYTARMPYEVPGHDRRPIGRPVVPHAHHNTLANDPVLAVRQPPAGAGGSSSGGGGGGGGGGPSRWQSEPKRHQQRHVQPPTFLY